MRKVMRDMYCFLSKPENFCTVSIFFDENEALSTIWSSLDGFHVAIVELGAVEFLSKPLSEDKLQNIWQHVVHKAFNAGANGLSESLKPVKESVESLESGCSSKQQ
ncbi:hypothetical protein ACSQ67_006027 [Phaseolus vulgaris]